MCSVCGEWYQGFHNCKGLPQLPPDPPATGNGPVRVCIRPLQALKCTTVLVHCYLDLGSGEVWAYDNYGVHVDQWPTSSKRKCVNVQCLNHKTAEEFRKRINDDKANGKWDGGDYRFMRHNCCHWVDNVLKALGCTGVEDHFPEYSLPTHPSSY